MHTENLSSSKQTALLLESARRRLVETGTRNRLIHVNRTAKRSNSLTIINERAEDVFSILRTNGRKMKFAATASEEDEDEQDELLLLLPNYADEEFDESRFKDQFLETPLTSDGLQKRLLRLTLDARTAEEEQGVNILFLAIGFLRWFEDKNSAVQREAPLLLFPVELVRNERTSTYDIRCRDEDVVTNLPLQERLRADFGIELPEIDETSDWTPSQYFHEVRDSVSGHPKWSIDEDGMQLGFFSFSKLLMLRDLDPENWPEDALTHSDLVQKLLEDGFDREPDLFDDKAKLDELLDPADVLHIVDTDASQAKVIEEVRSGRNLVVQGPPGTGKSQTITNILAAAAYDGKTVLFIAEKMAALQVVHKRMVEAGLADICLELHSRSANKKALLHELARTLSNGRSVPDQPSPPDQLKATRDELNRIADLLHTELPGRDFSPFEVIASIVGFIGRGIPAPRFEKRELSNLSSEDVKRIAVDVEEFAAALSVVGNKPDHPFFGVENFDLQPTDLQRLEGEIDRAIDAIRDLRSRFESASAFIKYDGLATIENAQSLVSLLELGEKAPELLSEFLTLLYQNRNDRRLGEAIATGVAWQETKNRLSSDFLDVAWDYGVGGLRADVAQGVGSFFSRLFGRYRKASSEFSTLLKHPLSKLPRDRLTLIDQLIEAQRKRSDFSDEEEYLKSRLGESWRGEKTEFAALTSVETWLAQILGHAPKLTEDGIQGLLKLVSKEPGSAEAMSKSLAEGQNTASVPIERLKISSPTSQEGIGGLSVGSLQTQLESIRAQMHRYREWAHLAECRSRLITDNLSDLVDLMETKAVDTDLAVDEFLYSTSEARWAHARSELADLDRVTSLDRHQLVDVFRKLDKSRIVEVQKLIRSKHLAQLPQGASGEMGFLRGEIAKKRRHRPIRKVMTAAGPMVQRIKPILMMSPISVAQFLPPGRVEFDLLVIDEASQVRPEESLGAIARAKQIVVVGDQKQLPPTSFFDRLTDDSSSEDDEEGNETAPVPSARAEEMESILTLCEARGLKPSMLEWHYRSRDPSLITVSNKEFYEDRLILPPTPLQMDDKFGLKFTRVPGVYSSKSRGGGRAGTNKAEAEAVIRGLANHAKNSPEFSVGIVTFSKTQADMMREVLEIARRSDSILDDFLRDEQSENVFVKNIENVQGDERDVILISVGYGPHEPNGRLATMNFGPINGDGGERRLNVLFTRARVRCEVFSSFDPGDIDLSRTTKDGPRVLKRFLEYAKSGELDQRIPTGEAADSPFEEDVARVISSMGYKADLQVGSAGFRIDIGVRHPDRDGQYILAVECDGATYHSAIWARERDRLRQDVLEGFGWRFHRIWSTDWFHNRSVEVERLRSALEKAVVNAEANSKVKGANQSNPKPPEAEAIGPSVDLGTVYELEVPDISVPAYQKASFSVRSHIEPHEVRIEQLCEFAISIVEIEGPVHTDEVSRRIANGFGKARTGSRIQEAVAKALAHAHRSGKLKRSEGFWFTELQANDVPVRDRSAETTPTNKPEYLSSMEIASAAELIRKESGEMEIDELVRSISRLLGFKRAGQEFQARVKSVLAG
ncbi:MAG: DUF3320 domain-containing protein [Sulfitobacter sp.]